MKRSSLQALIAVSALASLGADATYANEERHRKRQVQEPPRSFRRRARYYLDIQLRAEAEGISARGYRGLPPPAATPQPGPVKGTRKLSRAERKRMKARIA
jgi:hypothetical protein